MPKIMAPISGVYESRGGAQSVAFYHRRICGFTPAESLLFVAIVAMVFLRVTLVGAAVALPRHHSQAASRSVMVHANGMSALANSLNMTGISSLILHSGQLPLPAFPVGVPSDLFTGCRGISVDTNLAACTKQPMSTTDAARSNAATLAFREEILPSISPSSLSVPVCFQAIPRFTRLSGFGLSLDGLQSTASTPRLS